MDFLQQQRLDDLFFEADELIRAKQITQAISALEAIILEAPDYGKAYNHLGWIHETHYREYAKAETMYRQCMAVSPEYTPVYLNLSINLCTQAKFEDQEKVLVDALKVIGIDRPTIYNELGILRELQGRFSEAIAYYKDAIRFCLTNTNMDTYMQSIERCKRKQEILG